MNAVRSIVTGVLCLAAGVASADGTWRWTGAGEDALASNPENWEDDAGAATLPTIGADIVFDDVGAEMPCTWDLDIQLGSWTQEGYTNTVTVETCYDDKGEFNVLRVNGDMYIKSGSVASAYNWTGGFYRNMPEAPGQNLAKYALRIEVGGDLMIAEGVVIDAVGRGHSTIRPDGGGGGEGGSHGGPGGHLISGTERVLYGSITAPTLLGAGGGRGLGGGAVHLTVAGITYLDGRVSADGALNDVYAGAGGSVFLETGALAGSGRLSADGGPGLVTGGGGRIAVVLTGDGADFSQFDIVSQASCVSPGTDSYRGGAGTIYAEKKGDRKDHAWLIMKGNGVAPPDGLRAPRVCQSYYPVCDFDRVTVTNAALVRFPSGTQLVLTNTVVSASDAVAANDNGWWFAGGTVVSPEADTAWRITGVARVSGAVWPSDLDDVQVNADGKLWLDAFAVTLPGSVVNDGTLQLKNASALTLAGDWTNDGIFTSADDSKVVFVGTDDSTISGDTVFEKLICRQPGKSLLFEGGKTQSVTAELTLCGEQDSPLKLGRAGTSGTWGINVGDTASVMCQGLRVAHSDASSGRPITATMSASDGGENPGWTFVGDAVNAWSGSFSSDYADPQNWSMGKVPDSTEEVVVDSRNPMTISDTRTIAALTVAGASVVTIRGNVTIISDLVVTNTAKVVSDRQLTVGGDLWVHDGAVLTHSANDGATLDNMLDVQVFGNAYVVAGGRIDVSSMGPAGGPGLAEGSSYGGQGVFSRVSCYGSIFAPTNGGSKGARGGKAGGTMHLNIGGNLFADGSLLALAEPIGGAYCGTGGGIWIETGSLSGAGKIRVNGEVHSGGGRIAIRLNDQDASFDSFTGVTEAKGNSGGAGTIALQTAGDSEYDGTIVVDNGIKSFGSYYTDLPVSRLSNEATAFGKGATVKLVVRNGGCVNVTSDMRLGDLAIEQYGKMLLNGHVVQVNARRPKSWPADGSLPSSVLPGAGGSILWRQPGLMVLVR